MKTKRICLLSQAAKACKIPKARLLHYIEGGVGKCFLIEPVGELACWPKNIAADIKHNLDKTEDAAEIRQLQALAMKCKEMVAWMKSEGFTHFIEDIHHHDIEDPRHA